MFSTVYGVSKKIVINASFHTTSKNASIIAFVKALNKAADKNRSILNQVTTIHRDTVDERIKKLTGKNKLNLADKSIFTSLARSFSADIVVAGDVRFIAESYSLQLQAIIFDGKQNRKIKMIIKTGRFEIRDTLVSDFLNSISINIKKHFGYGNKSFSESVVKISNKNEVVAGVKRVPLKNGQTYVNNDNKEVSLDLLFKYSYIPTLLGDDTPKNMGFDFIVSKTKTLWALGFGAKSRITDSIEMELFYEQHFLRNSYNRHFQIYMRLGTGFSFSLITKSDFQFKISSAMGFRFSFSYFIFDLGAGVDYFINKDHYPFFIGGVGLHF